MVNRELIRIKIFQLVYAYFLNGNKDMNNAEKELQFSLEKANDLYFHMLQLIVAIRDEAEAQSRIAMRTSSRLRNIYPDLKRFVNNKFAMQLKENKQLLEFEEQKKLNWSGDYELVKEIFNNISQNQIYDEYMRAESTSYDADRELWRKLYKYVIVNNDAIDAVLEERSLYWNDDRFIEDTFVLKTIKRFKEENGVEQDLLTEYRDDTDNFFAINLFRDAIENADIYQGYMRDASINWDLSRLSYSDIIIMQIAIAEMMSFPAIAIEVTINEYIELAKVYSTTKSPGYINGMLDSIAHMLVERGELRKPIKARQNTNAEKGE